MIVFRLIKELGRWIVFTCFKYSAILRWKTTGKRQWVMLTSGFWGMAVVSNDDIRAYNRKAKKKHYAKMEFHTIVKTALYGTPAGSTGERKRHG